MLDLQTTHLAGHAVVRARGEFDPTSTQLRDYLVGRVDADDHSLVLDLHLLAGLDGVHGGVVADAAAAVSARGGRLIVVAADHVRESVRVADPTVVVSESLDAALGDTAAPLDPERGHVRAQNPQYPIMAFGA